MHHFDVYVGRDNKLRHCIVTLPTPPGAVPVQTFEQNRYALIIYTDKPYDRTAALLEQCLCVYIIIAITNNDRVACSHMQSFRSSSTGKPGHYG